MNKHIIDFMKGQKAASVCCADANGHPYCFSCYYTFNEKDHLLLFKTSKDSHHAQLLDKKAEVAGTILPDKLENLTVKGIQFSGILLEAEHILCVNSSKLYHKKFPFALAMSGDVMSIRLDTIKMTDSSMGFGKKLLWAREEEPNASLIADESFLNN